MKQLTEAAPEGELDSHLAEDVAGNRRNGKSKGTVVRETGECHQGNHHSRSWLVGRP